MNQYFFSEPNQSPWITEIYNEFLQFKTNGLVVEIGVGHTLKNVDNKIPDFVDTIERCGSNSADLIDLGWRAIFIEPVKEYCDEVLLSHKNNLDRIEIINIAASNDEQEVYLAFGDTLSQKNSSSNVYEWIGRKINSKKTSNILSEINCPNHIDVMSIDVEGYESKVLEGLDFRIYTPKILIVETNITKPNQVESLIPNTYKRVKGDDLNTVWVNFI